MVGRILLLLLSMTFSLKTASAAGDVKYELIMWTSDTKHSGTDDSIYARVYGEKKTTGWHYLDYSGYNDHETGDRNTYTFDDVDVDEIRCVELKIGGGDAYLLEKMEVQKLGSADSKKMITNSAGQKLSTDDDEGAEAYKFCTGGAETTYGISIKMSSESWAGTKHSMWIKVDGEKGETNWRYMRKSWSKNTQYNFYIKDHDVGQVTCVTLEITGDDASKPKWISIYSSSSSKIYLYNDENKQLSTNDSGALKRQRWCSSARGIYYDLYITTSEDKNSDTDSSIYARLSGVDGQTRWEHLDILDHDDFQKGKTDHYKLHDYLDVGDIVCVELKNEGGDWLKVAKIRASSSSSDEILMYNDEEQGLSAEAGDGGKAEYSWCTHGVCACTGINDKYWTASAEYDNNRAETETLSTEIVDRGTITNDASTTLTVSKETTNTKSFTHTAGASVTVGTSFTAEVPGVGSATTSYEATASYEFSYGTEKSETVSISKSYNCPGTMGKRTECLAMLFKERVTIPYTITWTDKLDSSCTCEEEGTYTEVASRSELQKNLYDL